MDSKVFKKEDKFYINYKSGKGNEIVKEVDLGMSEFEGQPENVEVSIGLTISPKQFESIRIDYRCSIHHRPGQEYREQAFELAKENCLRRLKDDVFELKATNTIKDHYLVDNEEGVL